MECSPSDCPDTCRFIIDYKYREGWCDYDGNDTLEYIREIYLSNFQVQGCIIDSCFYGNLNTDAGYGKYAFAIYCLLKNHQWDTLQLLNDTTWNEGIKSFFVYIRHHRCGKETVFQNSKNFTFCYNNQCCTWLYRMRFDGWGNTPYFFNPWRNSQGNEWYAKKLDSLYCNVTFQCPSTNLCRFCYCNFSLDSIPLPFPPKTSINEFSNNQKNNNPHIITNNSEFNFSLPFKVDDKIKIEIYNIFGQLIYNEILEYSCNNNEYKVIINNLNKGLYLFKIYSGFKIINYGKILLF